MKLASLKHGRDGKLIVVSKDLKTAVNVDAIAPNLQYALDNWAGVHHELDQVYGLVSAAQARDAFSLDINKLAAPLPRAYQWLDASAYVNHVELVRKARGVDMPADFWTNPLMYQGASDKMMGAHDDIELADEAWGIDFEAEIGIITGEVPMGVPVKDAEKHIRLLTLINDVSLRYVAKTEMAKGFGFLQAKPATAFSPVVVTPDELGDAWKEGRVHLPLVTHHNGQEFGRPEAGNDMVFNFPQLIAHAAMSRHLSAGTILGSGTVSNKDRSRGSSCIVERQTIEKLDTGEVKTPFMKFGDTVRIEMLAGDGSSIFGAIEQKLKQYAYKG
jgi:fumarylacetoacetate (FAA) hydrolase